jgi:hypothetical protein
MVNRKECTDRVLRAIEATISGDTSGVADLFTADVVAWSPTLSVSSRVELAVELEDQETGLSEVEVRPGPFVVEGNQICTEWVATALHADPRASADVWAPDAAEHRVRLQGATVAEFAGDEICAIRHYWDEGERRLELGGPPPAQSGRGPPPDATAPQETSPSLSPSELGRDTDSARDARGTSP